MGFTIAFLFLFSCYLVYIGFFLNKQKKMLTDKNVEFTKESLYIRIKETIRNLFYASFIMMIIGIFLNYKIENEEIKTWHVGLSLAIGTFIFFTLFLYWDITKPKILDYFKTNRNIVLDKEVISGFFVHLTISSFAFLLIQCTLSIIDIWMG